MKRRSRATSEKITYWYRWMNPLRDGKDAMKVNGFEVIRNASNEVTDLKIDYANVAELPACGHSHWQIENEAFNVLKTRGYTIEHNFGHGREHLASVCSAHE